MDIIADRGAIVVHCPQSNLHLGSGIAPIPELLQKKTNVALGTDGGNLGNLSMFETLRYAILIHRIHEVDYERWIKAADILRLMYDGGARVMQSKGKIGLLERGARADIIILDVNKASWQPMNNPTNQLVFYENGSSVDTVFVEGRLLLREGKIIFTNEAEIFAEAVEIANRVRRDNEASLKKVERQIPYLRKMYLRAMKE
jgi:cytosine/adenosine deaminase-related metal-dependent hydrolase